MKIQGENNRILPQIYNSLLVFTLTRKAFPAKNYPPQSMLSTFFSLFLQLKKVLIANVKIYL